MSDANTRSAAMTAVLAELHDGMIAEYDHGLTDGLNMVQKTFTRILAHPEITESMKPGLAMAIIGVETLIEEHANVKKAEAEKTETAVANN